MYLLEKGTVVPGHAMKAHKGTRHTVPFILKLSTRWKQIVSITFRALYLQWKKKPLFFFGTGDWVELVKYKNKALLICKLMLT